MNIEINQHCLPAASNTLNVWGGFSEGADMGGCRVIAADILPILKTNINVKSAGANRG